MGTSKEKPVYVSNSGTKMDRWHRKKFENVGYSELEGNGKS